MKLTSKTLTGIAAEVTKAQAQLTSTEHEATELLSRLQDANQSHAKLLEQREALEAQRESLIIELSTPADELQRIERLLSKVSGELTDSQRCIEAMTSDARTLAATLEDENTERCREATQANERLFDGLLATDELKQAWSVIAAYWLLDESVSWSDMFKQLNTIIRNDVQMPELARYRASDVLDELKQFNESNAALCGWGYKAA